MKPITFCIASANNEREYTKLLLRSLVDHTNINQHEILIFIDSDNQDTEGMLKGMQAELPNLKICRNPNKYPVGSQRNVSIMFNAAKNDIVCYLQSDMVVGKDFDKHIINNLISDDIVLACTRIEPPLHPASPEKFVKNFGLTPEDFDYNAFNEFVEDVQQKNQPNTDGHFAPFALYKKVWIEKLGGFDTQFRCSREDSDAIIRMELHNLKMTQSWKACVYHFTCVSSRGKDWFKTDSEAAYKNEIQLQADQQELKRFIRKWGFFGHNPKPVYDVALNIELDRYVDFNILKAIEPYCTRMYLSNKRVADQLANQLDFEYDYYANLRWGYTDEHWNEVKHLFNPTIFKERILSSDDPIGDTIINIKYSNLIQYWKEAQDFLVNIQDIVYQTEIGSYDGGFCTIHIHKKNNLMNSYAKHKDIELLLTEQKFEFN